MTAKTNILVVDDDSGYLSFLEALLKKNGFEVDTAGDGAEARQKFAGRSYNLLVSDVQMPNINGFELAAYVMEKKLNIPIILISAAATEATREKAKEVGVTTLLQKPTPASAIIETINKVLSEKVSRPKRNKKILVVDDDNALRTATVEFLESSGYEVAQARNGEAGLELAKNANPRFDIALVDENMPGISGHDVIERLSKISPETLPVLISGEASRDEVGKAYKAGAYSYLRKPIEFNLLLQCVLSYESEAAERRKKVEAKKELARHPLKRVYVWAMEYVNAPPNSPKNKVFRYVWITMFAVVVSLITLYLYSELQKYTEEMAEKEEQRLRNAAEELRRSQVDERTRKQKN